MSAPLSTPEKHECFVGLAYVIEHGLPGFPQTRSSSLHPDRALGKALWKAERRAVVEFATLSIAEL